MGRNEKTPGAGDAPREMGRGGEELNPHQHNSKNSGRKQAENTAERLFIESISFLEQLRPNGPWVLTAITPDGPTNTKTVRTAAEIDSFIHEHNGKQNIYYSVNPTKGAMFKKAKKSDIAAVEYLLGDLDPLEDETPEAAKTRYLEQLNSTFEPKPSVIVDSGNGIQCLWRLAERIELPSDAGAIIANAEARSVALMVRLGAKPGTQNIDRILRLPGTTNLPTKAKRERRRVECPTKLVSFNGARYSLDVFPLPEQNKPGTPEDGGHHEGQQGGDGRVLVWEFELGLVAHKRPPPASLLVQIRSRKGSRVGSNPPLSPGARSNPSRAGGPRFDSVPAQPAHGRTASHGEEPEGAQTTVVGPEGPED